MRNFLKIAEGVDVLPLLMAVHHHPELWGEDKARVTFDNSPHADVQDILLRFSDTTAENIGDQLICKNLDAMRILHQARPIIHAIMARVNGEILGRVMITKLASGKAIHPHSDIIGLYANSMRRFHVPLQSGEGCMFRAGDEIISMKAGEVWDFNAHAEHEVVNNSNDDRIHLIIDIMVSE
jgi:hypothetical protein